MANGWISSAGEFFGSLGASFIEHRARTKQRWIDGLVVVKQMLTLLLTMLLMRALKPVFHLKITSEKSLPTLSKTSMLLLTCVLSKTRDLVDMLRAATYTMIACK